MIAHSLGAVSTYLALRFGWLGTERLVLLAPMVEAGTPVRPVPGRPRLRPPDPPRVRPRGATTSSGIPVAEFDARVQAAHVDPVPTLVVHDRGDRQTPYADAERLVGALPDARLVTTEGLGHRRILRDPAVVAEVVDFVRNGERAVGRLTGGQPVTWCR